MGHVGDPKGVTVTRDVLGIQRDTEGTQSNVLGALKVSQPQRDTLGTQRDTVGTLKVSQPHRDTMGTLKVSQPQGTQWGP